ncbi:hypothetical protein LXL04_038835 [Taraxacum kok-saghyz]
MMEGEMTSRDGLNKELVKVVQQLNVRDLTEEDAEVVRDMMECGYAQDEIAFTLEKRDNMLVESVIYEVEFKRVNNQEWVDRLNMEEDAPMAKKRKSSEKTLKLKLSKYGPDSDGDKTAKKVPVVYPPVCDVVGELALWDINS